MSSLSVASLPSLASVLGCVRETGRGRGGLGGGMVWSQVGAAGGGGGRHVELLATLAGGGGAGGAVVQAAVGT